MVSVILRLEKNHAPSIRPGRKKNGTRVVIARLNYEIFLWRAHAQNDLRRVFKCPVIIAKQNIAFFQVILWVPRLAKTGMWVFLFYC